jgi:uncharacterized protein YkwD
MAAAEKKRTGAPRRHARRTSGWKFFLALILAGSVLAGRVPGGSPNELEKLENDLFFLVNLARSQRGLPQLRFDPRLRGMAREHSKKMAMEQELAHDFPGYDKLSARARSAGMYFGVIGENLAIGDTAIMRLYHEHMLASAGHSINILDKAYTHLGIGIVEGGGRYYITQEFASLNKP